MKLIGSKAKSRHYLAGRIYDRDPKWLVVVFCAPPMDPLLMVGCGDDEDIPAQGNLEDALLEVELSHNLLTESTSSVDEHALAPYSFRGGLACFAVAMA